MNMIDYYKQVPKDLRGKLVLYNRPASADPSSANNPLNMLASLCDIEDFCVVKVDVDTPSVELPWIQQILQCEDVSSRIDEFFFEHHVHSGTPMEARWTNLNKKVAGYFADTYHLLSEMRYRGIR